MYDLVENEYLKVPAQSSQALKILGMKDEPDCDLSEHCMKPYTCAFLDYCKRQHGVPENEPTVFDLYRMNFSKKLEHYYAGRITFNALRSEKLNDKQQMQVECTLNNTECLNLDGIRKFLKTLTYPLYFLDFETMQDAVPQYDGAKPYQQITFQYSLHIKENADAPYQHKEYLAPSDGTDPRRVLAEQIMTTLGCRFDQQQVGMFLWGRIPDHYANAEQLTERVLHEARVFITPGFIFGSRGERYIRISLCAKEEKIQEALERVLILRNQGMKE